MVEIIQGLTALFCSSSRLTLPAPSPSTWPTDTRWTEPQGRSLNATGTWTSSSTMRESVSGGTSWTPASQCSEMSWRQIISGPSLSHKVSQLGSTAPGPPRSVDVQRFLFIFLSPLTDSCLCPIAALLPSMVGRRSGHIVAISSVQGKIALPYRSACRLPLPFKKKKRH